MYMTIPDACQRKQRRMEAGLPMLTTRTATAPKSQMRKEMNTLTPMMQTTALRRQQIP